MMNDPGKRTDWTPSPLLASTGYLLARVGADSRRHFTRALAQHELNGSEFAVLMLLGAAPGIAQGVLAEHLGVDARNLVPILDGLESRRLVERTASPSDRRRRLIQLTTGGRRLLRRLQRTGEEVEREFLAPLTTEEREALRALLMKLGPGRLSDLDLAAGPGLTAEPSPDG
jgi:DNA-binding MarR family transcriptional regulator